MEERHPINTEDVPETEQPKHGAFYKIAIVCLCFLYFIAKGVIGRPTSLNTMRSNIRVDIASFIINHTDSKDSIAVRNWCFNRALPMLNKAICLDESNWRAWALKGALYTRQWVYLDSAAIFLRKTIQLQEEQGGVPDDTREYAHYVLITCLWGTHLPWEALDVAMAGVRKFPTSETMKKDVKSSVRQCYNQWLDACDTISDECLHAHNHKIILLMDTLCQNSFWEDAVWVISNVCKKYPENNDIKEASRNIAIEYADYLLTNSEDTEVMWSMSNVIWNVDRKRALNLRRKCARLGDEQAQEWFKQEGYEWD